MLAQETLPGSLPLAFSERLNVGNTGNAMISSALGSPTQDGATQGRS